MDSPGRASVGVTRSCSKQRRAKSLQPDNGKMAMRRDAASGVEMHVQWSRVLVSGHHPNPGLMQGSGSRVGQVTMSALALVLVARG